MNGRARRRAASGAAASADSWPVRGLERDDVGLADVVVSSAPAFGLRVQLDGGCYQFWGCQLVEVAGAGYDVGGESIRSCSAP